MITTLLMAEGELHKDLESAIDRYEDSACQKARTQAKEKYEVVDMTRCTCERIDSYEWRCFVRFTYTAMRDAQEKPQ